MPVPHTSGAFGDLLDVRFQDIFDDRYRQVPDMIPQLFDVVPHNGRNDMRWSDIGELPDFTQFTGSTTYQSQAQGYDVVATYVQWANGIQVERALFDDDQYHIMDQKPASLGRAAGRTRQKHAARIFNNAFSVDSLFYSHSEGVALCSNSHTTNSGASTSAGFDNLGTASLTATAVSAARIQMSQFRGDQGEFTSVTPDELWFPPDLYEQAHEIINSDRKPGVANNDSNVHMGGYTGYEWVYMTDPNNWFMCDAAMRKEMLKWVDRIPMELAMIEDLDTLVAKWRAYMRYSMAHLDWRWVQGHQVA